jgi:hypothetical protein
MIASVKGARDAPAQSGHRAELFAEKNPPFPAGLSREVEPEGTLKMA